MFQHRLQTFRSFDVSIGVNALPRKQKSIEILNRDRLNFRPQPIDCEPMDSCEQSPITPFLFGCIGVKLAAQNKTFAFKSEQRRVDLRSRKTKNIFQLPDRHRAGNFHSSAKQFTNRCRSLPILSLSRFRRCYLSIGNGVRINHMHHRQPLGGSPKTLVANTKMRHSFRCDEFIE